MSDVRKPIRSGFDRRKEWERIASENLGSPQLAERLIHWIDDDGLSMALHDLGLIPSSSGRMLSVKEVARECAEVFKEALENS